MTKLTTIEGIGEANAAKLKGAGVKTVEALLEKAATRQGRQALAQATGIADGHILKWANHADLFRIKGIGGEYAELLEAVGVDTVPELAQRNPENLYAKMKEVNEEKKLVRQLPTPQKVVDWVVQAKGLPRVMTY